MSGYSYPIVLMISFAECIEKVLTNIYLEIRGIYPLNIICFYIFVIFIIYLLTAKKKQGHIIYIRKTLNQTAQQSVKDEVQAKVKEIKSLIDRIKPSQNNNKQGDFIKKLDQAILEIKTIQDLHNEFKQEILDSHAQIIESLSPNQNFIHKKEPETKTNTSSNFHKDFPNILPERMPPIIDQNVSIQKNKVSILPEKVPPINNQNAPMPKNKAPLPPIRIPPIIDQNLSFQKKKIPVLGKTPPAIEKNPPVIEKNPPVIEKNPPAPEKIPPVIEKITPEQKKNAPEYFQKNPFANLKKAPEIKSIIPEPSKKVIDNPFAVNPKINVSELNQINPDKVVAAANIPEIAINTDNILNKNIGKEDNQGELMNKMVNGEEKNKELKGVDNKKIEISKGIPTVVIPRPANLNIIKPPPLRGKNVKSIADERSKYIPPPTIKSNPFG